MQKQKDDDAIDEISKDNNYLKEIVHDLYYKNIASFALRAMSMGYINNIRKDGADLGYFEEMIDELLAPFYLSGDAIFGFEISEKWSISVYIFDRRDYLLKAAWRKMSNSHPSSGMGRDWRPGEGHVGKAFLDRRPILTGNANDDAVSQLCRVRGSRQFEYDETTYISFASVPIAISDDDNVDPLGVLVVTSDREERLSKESTTELLMHAAETIAVILELSELDVGCLTAPNRGISERIEGEANVEST